MEPAAFVQWLSQWPNYDCIGNTVPVTLIHEVLCLQDMPSQETISNLDMKHVSSQNIPKSQIRIACCVLVCVCVSLAVHQHVIAEWGSNDWHQHRYCGAGQHLGWKGSKFWFLPGWCCMEKTAQSKGALKQMAHTTLSILHSHSHLLQIRHFGFSVLLQLVHSSHHETRRTYWLSRSMVFCANSGGVSSVKPKPTFGAFCLY